MHTALRHILEVVRRPDRRAIVPVVAGAFIAMGAASPGATPPGTAGMPPASTGLLAPTVEKAPVDLAMDAALRSDTLTFGFTLPATLEESGFTRLSALRLPVAALGYRLRYGGEDRPSVDLYLYPVVPDGQPVPDAGPGSRDDRSLDEFEQGIQDIQTMAQSGSRAVELDEEPRTLEVPTPSGTLRLHHQQGRYPGGPPQAPDGAAPARTHLWVGVTGRAVLKLRATYPEAEDDAHAPDLTAFIEELARQLEMDGQNGMADYDHHAALTQPVPTGLPEAFEVWAPPRLLSGWNLRGQQPLPDGQGRVLVYAAAAMAAPVQLFVRPFGHPDGVAVSEEPEAERTARVEARFREEVSNWRSSLTSQLASQGLEPEATEPLRRDPLHLATRYGPVSALHVTDRWLHAEGGGAQSHLVGFAVEDALVVAAIMAPEQAAELVEGLFMAMLEDFALNVLATRPPPNP